MLIGHTGASLCQMIKNIKKERKKKEEKDEKMDDGAITGLKTNRTFLLCSFKTIFLKQRTNFDVLRCLVLKGVC